jgi:hypothetical protein
MSDLGAARKLNLKPQLYNPEKQQVSFTDLQLTEKEVVDQDGRVLDKFEQQMDSLFAMLTNQEDPYK